MLGSVFIIENIELVKETKEDKSPEKQKPEEEESK